MPSFVAYEEATGKILKSGFVSQPQDLPLQTDGEAGVAVLEVDSEEYPAGVNDKFFMVDVSETTLEIIPRPDLAFDKLTIIADGVDEAVLSDLPDPCMVVINGQTHEVTGGSLELSADVPATYVVEIRNPFPYQRFRAEVVAT